MTDPTYLLEVAAIHLGYGDIEVVHGASLRAAAGEITVVLGRNGAGKSTLLKGIAGLIPAKSGRVDVGGICMDRLAPWSRATQGVSIVLEGKRIFRDLTVGENLAVALSGNPSRRTVRTAQERSYSLFPRLAEMRDRRGADLSGGQQQMLAIAQAVVAEPRVLLVDEPSSGLSPIVFDEILGVLDRLRDTGMAVVLVEQMVDEVLNGPADHAVVLSGGRVVLDQRAAEVDVGTVTSLLLHS